MKCCNAMFGNKGEVIFVSSILMVKYIINECRFEHLKSLFLKVMGEHYGPSCE